MRVKFRCLKLHVAWIASAFLHKPARPPPLPSLLPNGMQQLAQHSHLCLSPKRSFRGAVEDDRGPWHTPDSLNSIFCSAELDHGERCHPLPLARPLATTLQPPACPAAPSLAPSPGLHFLQTLETSLHLNKGLTRDLTPHWDPASSPQPCSKLLFAALHNLAFNENYTIYLHLDTVPAAQQSHPEDVPTPCASLS